MVGEAFHFGLQALADPIWVSGTTFVFASTGGSFMLYSVHDGKPVLKHSPLPFDEHTRIYLLNWEQTLAPGQTIPREDITADGIQKRLPFLSAVKKVHEKQWVTLVQTSSINHVLTVAEQAHQDHNFRKSIRGRLQQTLCTDRTIHLGTLPDFADVQLAGHGQT